MFQIQPSHIAFAVGLAVFIISLLLARIVTGRAAVQRRIASSDDPPFNSSQTDPRALSFESDAKTASFLVRVGALLQTQEMDSNSDLRKQLVQAGFFSSTAVVAYHGSRFVIAMGLLLAVPVIDKASGADMLGAFLPLFAVLAAGIGFMLPSVWIDWRKKSMRTKYRNVFPDFMDLVVVCIESGQSLQGAIDRVSREIVQFSPQLGANLHLVNLELRAGRTLTDALLGLHQRVGIDEVKSLQVLLKQSEELGASISASLRVFTEEMREKRLVRAETKAHTLPVKMTIPLGIFIFPVILMVILVPVVIRFKSVFGALN